MKTRIFLLAGIVLFITLGCNLFSRNQGYIVYQAVDNDGEALPELVVVDPKGEEVSRIDLPGKDTRFFPFRIPLKGRVFFQDPFNERFFLVDVVSGEITDYDGFGEAEEFAQPCSSGMNWVLLCGGSQDLYMLDAESGKVSEVGIPSDSGSVVPLIPYQTLVNSAETHLLLGIRNEQWLVEIADPDGPRKLGDERSAYNAAFSADGKTILYSQIAKERETQVMKEQLDGSGAEEIFSGSEIARVYFVPKHDQLILAYRDSVSLYSLDDEEETELFESADMIRDAHFDPAGTNAVFGTAGFVEDTVTWTYVDLKEGSADSLDDLDGYFTAYKNTLYPSPWLFLVNTTYAIAEGAPDPNVASLDLETGRVRELLTIEEASFFTFLGISQDGRVALALVMLREGGAQLWLLQADREDAQLLAEANSVNGSLSPDGRWVVVGEMQKDGDRTKTKIMIMETSGDKAIKVGEGLMPVWVQP